MTAGGNLAFMNAVLAVADPGDEIILQTPFYFNSGRRDGLLPPGGRLDGHALSAPCGRYRGRDHAAHARHRHDLAEQPEGRRL